jgi:hypothetical protein
MSNVFCVRAAAADFDDLFDKILDVMPLSSAINESHAKKVSAIKSATSPADRPSADGDSDSFPDLHNEVFP